MKETDAGFGCILTVVAFALAGFILYHGGELAARLLGHC